MRACVPRLVVAAWLSYQQSPLICASYLPTRMCPHLQAAIPGWLFWWQPVSIAQWRWSLPGLTWCTCLRGAPAVYLFVCFCSNCCCCAPGEACTAHLLLWVHPAGSTHRVLFPPCWCSVYDVHAVPCHQCKVSALGKRTQCVHASCHVVSCFVLSCSLWRRVPLLLLPACLLLRCCSCCWPTPAPLCRMKQWGLPKATDRLPLHLHLLLCCFAALLPFAPPHLR